MVGEVIAAKRTNGLNDFPGIFQNREHHVPSPGQDLHLASVIGEGELHTAVITDQISIHDFRNAHVEQGIRIQAKIAYPLA
jgi:hypothetical protein